MLNDLRYRLRSLFRRRRFDAELQEELAYHIDRQAEKHRRAGLAPAEALRRARLELGGPVQIEEATREAWGTALLDHFLRDLRFGARSLRQSPVFAVVAIVSLALGIGANTTIFQLLDAVVLRTLPVRDPHGLAEIRIRDFSKARGNFNRYPALTNPQWEQIRDRQRAFAPVFAWANDELSLTATGEVRGAHALWVSGAFFDALGVPPRLGRVFTPADDVRGCGLRGAVLSYGFWQGHFAGDPDVIGRSVMLNRNQVPVIGVTGPEFLGLDVGRAFDVALPLCAEQALRPATHHLDDGLTWWLTIMGRLRPGVSLESASTAVDVLSPGVFETTVPGNYPAAGVQAYRAMRLEAVSAAKGLSGLRKQYEDPLRLLLATAGLVMLIACANLANLMLARGNARRREIAVRLAIGAPRSRIVTQLLAESALIAAAGVLAGLALSRVVAQVLVAMLGEGPNRVYLDLSPDWRVLLFAAALGSIACIGFGVVPALRSAHSDPGDALRSESRGTTSDRRRFVFRRALAACQLALSLVLLTGALLFVRTLSNLMAAPFGFQPGGLAIVSTFFGNLKLPPARYESFKQDMMERFKASGEIEAVAQATITPFTGNSRSNGVWMDGDTSAHLRPVSFSDAGPGYFATVRTPFAAGRDFDAHDDRTTARVAIVNEAFAREIARGNPVGRRFWVEATPSDPETVYEIVGVVKDAKFIDAREQFQPMAFFPLAQAPHPYPGVTFVLRSSLPIERLAPIVRQTMADRDPSIRYTLDTASRQLRSGLRREQLMAALSSGFGFLAAVISAVGIYGVFAYMMTRRRNEIGIRMALGASRGNIVGMVLRETAALLAIGLCVGLALAMAGARAAESLLYGLTPHDPATLALAAAGITLVTLGATWLPARRAARLDPTRALRAD